MSIIIIYEERLWMRDGLAYESMSYHDLNEPDPNGQGRKNLNQKFERFYYPNNIEIKI